MINVETVKDIVNQQIDPNEEFVVEVSVSSGNKILVLLDGEKGITIDRCVRVSKAVEQQLDRDKEDFEIEVSSAGLSMPFKVVRQYSKNIGRDLEVVLTSGEKESGKLLTVNENGFELEIKEMVKPEGKKRKELVVRNVNYLFPDVKSAKVVISFK